MHPKAALLALAGLMPMRHNVQGGGRSGYRVGAAFTKRALYLRSAPGYSGVGDRSDLSRYTELEWNDIPQDLWDRVTDETINNLLGEIYEN